MKKLIISVALSSPLLLTSFPTSSAPSFLVANQTVRVDASGVNNTISKPLNYAYWHRDHHWHHGYGWHRGYHYYHWPRGHRWHHYHR